MYRLKSKQTINKCFRCGKHSTYRAKYFMFGSCTDCLPLAEVAERQRLLIEESSDGLYH